MRAFLVGFVRTYRALVSPHLPPACRFVPSCSEYAEEAIARRGTLVGTWLAARRLLRCHPWGGSGYDPVEAACPGSSKTLSQQSAADSAKNPPHPLPRRSRRPHTVK